MRYLFSFQVSPVTALEKTTAGIFYAKSPQTSGTHVLNDPRTRFKFPIAFENATLIDKAKPATRY